jgi:predicted enzyme related to lactoylglutathione lyase
MKDMKVLGRIVLLVHDYDEALRFYCGVLGFTILHDSRSPDGQRFVHIGLPGQGGNPPVGLWLLTPADPAEQSLVGRQAGSQPLLVLYVDDCASETRSLEARGVKVRRPPRSEGGAVFSHIEDLYGNELVLVQLAS